MSTTQRAQSTVAVAAKAADSALGLATDLVVLQQKQAELAYFLMKQAAQEPTAPAVLPSMLLSLQVVAESYRAYLQLAPAWARAGQELSRAWEQAQADAARSTRDGGAVWPK